MIGCSSLVEIVYIDGYLDEVTWRSQMSHKILRQERDRWYILEARYFRTLKIFMKWKSLHVLLKIREGIDGYR